MGKHNTAATPGIDSAFVFCDKDAPHVDGAVLTPSHGDFADAIGENTLSMKIDADQNVKISFRPIFDYCRKNSSGHYAWVTENFEHGDVVQMLRHKGLFDAVRYEATPKDPSATDAAHAGLVYFEAPIQNLMTASEYQSWQAGKVVDLHLSFTFWLGPSSDKLPTYFYTGEKTYDHTSGVDHWINETALSVIWNVQAKGNQIHYRSALVGPNS